MGFHLCVIMIKVYVIFMSVLVSSLYFTEGKCHIVHEWKEIKITLGILLCLILIQLACVWPQWWMCALFCTLNFSMLVSKLV